jgi:ribosomal protein S18 acetylase RimI-like enzyme
LQIILRDEATLAADDHARIQALLVAAFPQHAEIFAANSYWGSLPEYRLWLEDDDGMILAHAEFGRRLIHVGDYQTFIAGIGAVATHPEWQRRGLGRTLFTQLQAALRSRIPVDFGFLECRDEVVEFYEKAGFTHMQRVVRCFEPDERIWVDCRGNQLVLPATRTIDEWPAGDLIDLRGMPW